MRKITLLLIITTILTCSFSFAQNIDPYQDGTVEANSGISVLAKGFFGIAEPSVIDENGRELYFVIFTFSKHTSSWNGTLCFTSNKNLFKTIRSLNRRTENVPLSECIHISGTLTKLKRENKFIEAIEVSGIVPIQIKE